MFLISCNSGTRKTSFFESSGLLEKGDVTIELSIPNGDSLRTFGLCWDKNPVDVIIRNQTDSVICFYEDWNSWGYFNIKFQIETADSTYMIMRIKRGGWWKNFPSIHKINPNQSLVFHYELIDSSCAERFGIDELSKRSMQWTGLPRKGYKSSKIRAIYELPKEYELLDNTVFMSAGSKNESTFMFSQKLISEPLSVRIIE